MVAAAVIGSAVVTAGIGAASSSAASNAQQASANNATQAQLAMYNKTRADLSPYNEAGQNALTGLSDLTGQNGIAKQQQILQNMPGYQFTLNQGLKSTQNSAAARGLGSSGAALRGAADYSTGLAQSNYGNYFNQLMSQATLGENAAAQTGAYGTQTGTNIGNNYISAGNAQAAGYLGAGNSINNAINAGTQGYLANNLLNNGAASSGFAVNPNVTGWVAPTSSFGV